MAASLEQSQVAHYLLSLGLVKPRAVIEEDLSSPTSRAATGVPRHVVGGPGVRRQAGGARERRLRSRTRPRCCGALAGVAAVAGLVPSVVAPRPGGRRLVLRSPAGALAGASPRRFPPGSARVARPGAGRAPRSAATARAAAAPASARLGPARCRSPRSSACVDERGGARPAGAHPGERDALRAAARAPRAAREDAFVHGDLRWDNCLLVAAPGARRRTRVLLIDWELAGRGDAGADLGVRAGRLPARCGRLDPDRRARPSRAGSPPRRARRSSGAARDGALWAATARGTRPVDAAALTELVAVRLLETAMEHAQRLRRLGARAGAAAARREHAAEPRRRGAWHCWGCAE